MSSQTVPMSPTLDENVDAPGKTGIAAYVELTKPGILRLVLVTTVIGFALGGNGLWRGWLLLFTILGTGLASAGAFVLNHYVERDLDARMERTRNRPLPRGTVSPKAALGLGVALVAAGTIVLAVWTQWLAAALVLVTALLYVLVYTPLKRVTWWNTPVGAIPGAMPPMIGWAAATGRIDAGAWILFLILFLWQHPHFYALAWMYREDYARGGIKMLPVTHPDGRSTFRQSLACAMLLVPVSLWPTFIDMSGWVYFVGALACGSYFLYTCVRWHIEESARAARRVFVTSIFYWMALFLLIVVDAWID